MLLASLLHSTCVLHQLCKTRQAVDVDCLLQSLEGYLGRMQPCYWDHGFIIEVCQSCPAHHGCTAVVSLGLQLVLTICGLHAS